VTGDSAGGESGACAAIDRLRASPQRSRCSRRRGCNLAGDRPRTDPARASRTRAEADPYFTKSQVAGLVASYLGETDPKNPLASPLYGDLSGLPPIRVHVGDDEVLLDDSRRYVERAVAAGVDAALDVWMGMPHGFVAAVAGSALLDRHSAPSEPSQPSGCFKNEQAFAKRENDMSAS